MLSVAIKSKIDALWDKFWSGGIANPLTAIEQINQNRMSHIAQPPA